MDAAKTVIIIRNNKHGEKVKKSALHGEKYNILIKTFKIQLQIVQN